MGAAVSFTTVTLIRDYDLANGAEPAGRVVFTLDAPMVNAGKTVVAVPITVVLDATGSITTPLIANTDPTTTPAAPFTSYHVREEISGAVRQYYVRIPHDAGPVVDLGTLLTLSVPAVLTYPAAGPAGPQGPAGATGGIDTEGAQDATATLFANGTHTGISFTYNDAAASLSATVIGGGGLDTEAVQDVIGAAVTGSTYITRTYDDATGLTTLAASSALTNRFDSLDGYSDIGDVGSTLTITPGGGNGTAKLFTLTAASCTLTFNDPATDAYIAAFEMVITQGTGGNKTVIWPGDVKWDNGVAPVLSTTAGAIDRIAFVTYNGGANWYGDLIGKAYA